MKSHVAPALFIDTLDDNGLLTPAGRSAKNGHTEAVLFLVRHGADPNIAAMGAAMGGHYDLANRLRAKYGASINYIAKGTASAGDFVYLDELCKKHGASGPLLAEGVAMYGDLHYVHKFRKYHAIRTLNQDGEECIDECIAETARGIGFSASRRELDMFFPAFTREPLKMMIKGHAAYGVMLAGDVDYAKELLKESHDLIGIVKAAVLSGKKSFIVDTYKDQIKKLRKELKGRHEQLETLLLLAMIEGFLLGAARDLSKLEWFSDILDFDFHSFQHERLVNTFLRAVGASGQLAFANYVVLHQSVDDLSALCEGLAANEDFKNTDFALHRCAFANLTMLIRLQRQYPLALPETVRTILPKAIKLNKLMTTYDMNYDQALDYLNSVKVRKPPYSVDLTGRQHEFFHGRVAEKHKQPDEPIEMIEKHEKRLNTL